MARYRFLLFLLIANIIISTRSVAQQTPPEPADSSRLKGNYLLNQSVITAGRYEQNLKRMRVSTEIIQPYLIRNKNTTMMDDLLDQIPGVNIIDGQINIRSGSGWTYGVGSRVGVLLDDMPFLTGDASQVKWNFIPIENVKQVEVVKGPASVLYGSGALSGMVHFRTEMATVKPISRFSVFSGSFSQPKRESLRWRSKPGMQYGATAFHSFRKNKNTIAISGNYFKDEGFRMGETDERLRLNANLVHKHSEKLTLGLNLGYLYSNGGSFLLWESYEKGYTSLDSQTSTTLSRNFYIDPYVIFFTGKFKHHLKTRLFAVDNDNSPSSTGADQDNSNKFLYAEYQVQRYWSGSQLMLVGGWVSNSARSQSPLYNGFQLSSNHAMFLQADKQLGKRLNATAGARFEYFNMNGKAESKPVFRAGINYELAKATFVRASWGQGYRFPSIAERYIQTNVGLLNIFPNPNLKSETGWNAEIGLKQGFEKGNFRGFADIAFFYTRYNNMIDFNLGMWKPITDPFNPFASYGFISLNIGETRISGVDCSLNAEAKWGNVRMMSLLGYTFTQPLIVDPDYVFATDSLGYTYSFRSTRSDSTLTLKYRFKHLFKWDLQAGWKRWELGYSIRYNSYMENIDAAFVQLPLSLFVTGIAEARKQQQKGNLVADARVSYQINSSFKVSILITNLTNAEIMTRPADIRPPRLTVINLNYSF